MYIDIDIDMGVDMTFAYTRYLSVVFYLFVWRGMGLCDRRGFLDCGAVLCLVVCAIACTCVSEGCIRAISYPLVCREARPICVLYCRLRHGERSKQLPCSLSPCACHSFVTVFGQRARPLCSTLYFKQMLKCRWW